VSPIGELGEAKRAEVSAAIEKGAMAETIRMAPS